MSNPESLGIFDKNGNLVEVISNKKVNNKDRDKYIEKYVFPVRKCAHFTIYLILGILVISLLSEYRILNFKTVLYTLLIVFLYACSDEFHQLFVSGRSSEIGDVLIDSSGGFIGSYLYYLFRRKRK